MLYLGTLMVHECEVKLTLEQLWKEGSLGPGLRWAWPAAPLSGVTTREVVAT